MPKPAALAVAALSLFLLALFWMSLSCSVNERCDPLALFR